MIAAANDGLFRLLCERIGLAELADDPRFPDEPRPCREPRAAAAADRTGLPAETSAHWLERLAREPRAARSGSRCNGRPRPDAPCERDASRTSTVSRRWPRRSRSTGTCEHPAAPPLLGEHSVQVLGSRVRRRRHRCGTGPRRNSRLARVIDLPQKIVCGRPQLPRPREGAGGGAAERGGSFAKWPNTLLENGAPIRIPAISRRINSKAELGVVIGERAGAAAPTTRSTSSRVRRRERGLRAATSSSRTASGCAASRSTRSYPWRPLPRARCPTPGAPRSARS